MRDFLLNVVLRHPLGILFVHYLVADALGADIIASLAVFAIDSRFAGIFDTQGIYGEFHGFSDIWVLFQRVFRLGFFVVFIPYAIIMLLFLVVICLRSQSLVWKLNNRQRWASVLLMQVAPLLFLLFEMSRFSQMALFAGPIHGFHPLTPISIAFFQLTVPLLFWWIISWLNQNFAETPKKPKGK
jgi:hypothetical protein